MELVFFRQQKLDSPYNRKVKTNFLYFFSHEIEVSDNQSNTATSISSQEQQISHAVSSDELPPGISSPEFNVDAMPELQVVESEDNRNAPVATEILMVGTEGRSNIVDVSEMTVVQSDGNNNEHNEVVEAVEPQLRLLKIHRLNVKQDMISAFKDPSIMDCKLTFVFIDARGIEEKGSGVGVERDALSLFWKDVYDSLLIGENERVPCIRHDYSRSDWEAVARILVKGFRTCQYLPLLLSKTYLSYVLFGEPSVTDVNLIQSFMQYISTDERRIIDKCLSEEMDFENEDESDELLDVLKVFDCRSRVTKENVKVVIKEIAHKEIIQKPQYVTDCWKDIVQALAESFHTAHALTDIYERLIPSVSKISKCIQSSPESDAERECLKFLQRYIKGLDTTEKLATFVRFISGSELMLFEGIQVTFTDLYGAGRRPIARTCNTLLQLPSTYQSFPELREEFNHVLMSGNWEMDLI